MFDWPEQIQTSPTSTSSSLIVVFPSNLHGVGLAVGLQRGQLRPPPAVGAGLDRDAVDLGGAFECHDHDGSRVGGAPDPDRLLLLEDHVVAEDLRDLDLGHGAAEAEDDGRREGRGAE